MAEDEDLKGVADVDGEEEDNDESEFEEWEEADGGVKTDKGVLVAKFSALLVQIHTALGTKTFTPRELQQLKLLPAGQKGTDLFAELMNVGYIIQNERRSWTYNFSAVALAKIKACEEEERKKEMKRKKRDLQQAVAFMVLKQIREDLQTHRLEVYSNLGRWRAEAGKERFKTMMELRQVLNVLCRGRNPTLRLEDDAVYVVIMVPSNWPPLKHLPPPRLQTWFGTGPRESPLEKQERLARARARSEAMRQAEEARVTQELDAALRQAAERRGGSSDDKAKPFNSPMKGGGRIVVTGWDAGDDFNQREQAAEAGGE